MYSSFLTDIKSQFPSSTQHPFQRIVLECEAINFIPNSFHWYRNGTEILNGQEFVSISSFDSGHLSRLNLSYDDYADNSTWYRCLATNNVSHMSVPEADGQVFADWPVRCMFAVLNCFLDTCIYIIFDRLVL